MSTLVSSNEPHVCRFTLTDLIFMMLAALGLFSYRLFCLLGYGYVAYWTFENRPAKVSLKENVFLQTRFLTIDTLLLHVLYYALAILLMPTRCNKVKSVLSCLALTTATVVSVMFWGIDYFDRSLLMDLKTIEFIPSWFIHATHTFISITALFDVLLSRPHPVPLWKSFLIVFSYFLGYTLYTEYLIYKHGFHPYPMLKLFTVTGRYQFYGVAFCIAFLVFLVSSLVIRLASSDYHRKPKRDKAKNKKPQQQPQHHQHQQPQKQSLTPTSAKKKKQAKQD
ncbi:hypothetical protein EGR_05575 [Echinococcus granulosus]|uniref:FAR 17a AIG1 protein n=2 Tax=Echinococcus granulosus TaxID=6210 RepID=W6UES1_ECHGR|nr:hypothetical protein EGR_05575 [Echinococcus granulosus]EUB59548.1 hypothetical protein EGR_05575 [Echinococcus granulosus]